MKIIRNLIIFVAVLIIVGITVKNIFNVEVVQSELPTEVYEQESNLLTLVQLNLVELFVTSSTSEAAIIEQTTNYIIVDSIRENVNEDYAPTSDCDDSSCMYVIEDENYYIDYVWASTNEEEQLVLNISVGTSKYIDFNTIMHLYFDVEINYLSFEIVYTLDHFALNNTSMSKDTIIKILDRLDIQNVDSNVTKGTLDLDELSYTISFSPFD